MFAGTVPEGTISGIKKAQTFRITACSDGSGIEVYYKFDVSKRGWLPRPLPATLCNQWKDEFTHPVSPINQGILCYIFVCVLNVFCRFSDVW